MLIRHSTWEISWNCKTGLITISGLSCGGSQEHCVVFVCLFMDKYGQGGTRWTRFQDDVTLYLYKT